MFLKTIVKQQRINIYIYIYIFFFNFIFSLVLMHWYDHTLIVGDQNPLVFKMGFAMGFSYSVFLPFFQSYVKHDLRKNKIVVRFFAKRLVFMS
jgi:hypothetical protein